jgi:hypothetical protein
MQKQKVIPLKYSALTDTLQIIIAGYAQPDPKEWSEASAYTRVLASILANGYMADDYRGAFDLITEMSASGMSAGEVALYLLDTFGFEPPPSG